MSKRISYSVLDPFISKWVPFLYRLLHIPKSFPPEGIVLIGHVVAVAGAFGFALSVKYWFFGIIAALGVIGNHLADMVDGTHARTTGQCRNGGELLDHFTDPLSFSYWMIGIAFSTNSLKLGLASVICIYATAVLTSIKAKITGEFTLARFGSTEFKALLTIYGIFMVVLSFNDVSFAKNGTFSFCFLTIMVLIGIFQLIINLKLAVVEVNTKGAAPDTSDWNFSKFSS